jgi:RNase H-fold protein (predicted Holliday junction resolvase)
LFEDERLTTAEAEDQLIATGMSREKRALHVDALAAAIILRGALRRMGQQ